ncbi:MAG: nitrate ABC transporter substrate-binding protein, partial [Cyanobacteria bacterium J06633_23]
DKVAGGGEEFFLTDLARELAQELGVDAPEELSRIETMKFGDFDPSNPDEYLKQQIEKFGV